jgi:predicted nucleotide-binding protein
VDTVAELEACQSAYRKWDSYNTELLKQIFTTPLLADEYSHRGAGVMFMRELSLTEKLHDLRHDIGEKLHRIESIQERLELMPLAVGVTRRAVSGSRPNSNRAFIVHGHDDAARESVARFLEKLGVEAVVLHEQATSGRSILEKLEHYADVDFAVVLLTPDDIGEAKDVTPGKLQPRARQNVVLELGYFIGKLGRAKVCALHRAPLELPSEFLGIGYVPFDSGGGWQLQLARELRAAGFTVDLNAAV